MPRGSLLVPQERVCDSCGLLYIAISPYAKYCPPCRPRGKYRRYALKVKEAVYLQYGNCCKKCGFVDRRALQLDHVFGGGTKERKEKQWSNASVYRDALNHPEKYQILCANCNAIKRYENKEIEIDVTFCNIT